jgi:hypothetical protein
MVYGALLGLAPLFWACASGDGAKHQEHGTQKAEAPPPVPSVDPEVAKGIGDLFKRAMDSHPKKNGKVQRAVFLKDHGCAHGQFIVHDNQGRFHQGLFADPGVHEAYVRMSSDTPGASDLANNTIGFAVKVLDVPGKKVLEGEEDAQTHDFLTQNINVFFVDTAKDMLDFTQAGFTSAEAFDEYENDHPTTKRILGEMQKFEPNILKATFWSTTPYKFGDEDFAKYKVVPCTKDVPVDPSPMKTEGRYLRTRLVRDVKALGMCFDFQVQLRENDMPLDAQTVVWDEDVSKPQTVATIMVPPQDIVANDAKCEDMEFTAWHALEAQRPVGTINEARGIIYKRLSDIRRKANGLAITEPEPTKPMNDSDAGAATNSDNEPHDSDHPKAER